jgi:pimeloyl-ACP methyl ester carboxylesterase
MPGEVAQRAPETLQRNDGVTLAFRRIPGRQPTVVWMCGFSANMDGTKAGAIAQAMAADGRAFLRFDYSGHGASGGRFEAGTIGGWRGDALAVLDAASAGKVLLVGSSMGAWIALLTALARPARVAGLVLIAPAPDFTERLVWQNLTFPDRRQIIDRGYLEIHSPYAEAPTRYTRALVEEGRAWGVLERPIPFLGPVRILHGQQDPDVPWRQSLLLAEQLQSTDVATALIKDGDHRLSRPQDIALLIQTIRDLAGKL